MAPPRSMGMITMRPTLLKYPLIFYVLLTLVELKNNKRGNLNAFSYRWPLPLVAMVAVLPELRGGVCVSPQAVFVRGWGWGRRLVSPWDPGWEEPWGDPAVLQTTMSRYKGGERHFCLLLSGDGKCLEYQTIDS